MSKMEKGQINVQTENIFPIIKQFLYTDQEIFLREIVSNAVDATMKLKTLASNGNYNEELGDLSIVVSIDKKKKTLTVSDKGIGMTKDEVIKYITEIAFSGASEFVNKFKNKSDNEVNAIIGHFGMGFYSTFMVSDKVEIETKTYKTEGQTKAVHWECDGETEYKIGDSKREERGTDIILHISDEAIDYLDEFKILQLLKKHCRFLPIPIIFGTETINEEIPGETDEKGNAKTKEVVKPRVINDVNPLWKQKPSDLKTEDYNKFYHELYPSIYDEPLFNVHINVDYPFNLTGILYFPKVKRNADIHKEKIQLYCNQVFVTDNVEGIVPEFLTLLHGVLDSPDIPLNVSRSSLQSDSNVKKISSHILKKVSDKLDEIFRKEREEFEKKWNDIKIFIEYGIISEPDFYDKAIKFTLFKNLDNKYSTLEEYKGLISANQTDKDNNIVILYATDADEQYSFIQSAKEVGYDVIILDEAIDGYFINAIEQKNEKVKFVRVDADVTSKLIDKGEDSPSKLSEKETEKVKGIFEGMVDKSSYTVVTENLGENDLPIIITMNEFMRRMKDMSKINGGYGYMGSFPDSYTLKVNVNHPLISKIIESEDEERSKNIAEQLIDLAKLQQNILKGEKLDNFVKRSLELIK